MSIGMRHGAHMWALCKIQDQTEKCVKGVSISKIQRTELQAVFGSLEGDSKVRNLGEHDNQS